EDGGALALGRRACPLLLLRYGLAAVLIRLTVVARPAEQRHGMILSEKRPGAGGSASQFGTPPVAGPRSQSAYSDVRRAGSKSVGRRSPPHPGRPHPPAKGRRRLEGWPLRSWP